MANIIRLRNSNVLMKDGKATCACCGGCEIVWEEPYVYEEAALVGHQPWLIQNNNHLVKFILQDSQAPEGDAGSCGTEINPYTQLGDIVGTITVPAGQNINLNIVVTGNVEQEDTNYENLDVYLDGQQVVDATSVDAGQGCAMGAPIVNYLTPMPIELTPGPHQIHIWFTSGDALWHVNSSYDVEFVCTPVDPPA